MENGKGRSEAIVAQDRTRRYGERDSAVDDALRGVSVEPSGLRLAR
jgi:hypothetical protein